MEEKMNNDIKVSVCASAARPILDNGFQNWKRFLESLKGNKISYEVVFVGNVRPPQELLDNYPELKYIYATVKPCQAYQIAFHHAKGELIHWTADDADYNHPRNHCPNALDVAYNTYKRIESENGNDRKTVIAMRPIEDGGDPQGGGFHRLRGGDSTTKVMAPLGVLNREMFNELGGYDKRFVSGQAENDVVMRFYEIGGRVHFEPSAYLYIHHRQVHPKGTGTNKFRNHYPKDREILENAWVKEGYGQMDSGNAFTVPEKRILPVESFEVKDDWLTVSQGAWGKEWDEGKR